MPVINPGRDKLQIPSARLESQPTNFMVGTAGVNPEQWQDRKGRALMQFLGDAGVGFNQAVEENGARAAVQGALDATTATNALEEKDERVSKQNWLMRDYYKSGYINAAVGEQLAQYRVDSTERAKQAALSGMSDEDFKEQEQKATAEFQQKMASFLPDMPKEGAVYALNSLRQTSAANYKEFMQQRAKQALVQADRALDKNLSSTVPEFYQRIQAGSYADAQQTIKNGLQSILVAEHLDKDKKLDRVKQYLTAVAQDTDNPMVIDELQKIATSELGINAVDVNKALFEQFKRAGNQMEGQAMFEVSDMIQSLEGKSPEQQQSVLADMRQKLVGLGAMGVISPSTQMGFWKDAQTARDKANAAYALQDTLDTGKTPATFAAMSGIDLDKARNTILDKFPDTAMGNVQLLQYGTRAKDPWSIETAQGRMGKQMASTIATMDQLGEDGQLSVENQATINTFSQMYRSATLGGKSALSNQIPEEYRGIVQRAIAQSPNNASNIIMDDLRRLRENRASGRYDSIAVNPSEKMVDPSGTSNWFSFGDTADSQRQESRAAMEAEYRYMYRKNPEALVGKSADDINTMLKGNIQARKLEVEVAGKPRFVYLPAGSTLKDYMGSYQGSTEQFTNALQSVIGSAVESVVDSSNLERVIVQAGTAGSAGSGMTVTAFTKDGNFQNISIDPNQVSTLAQERYNEELAGQLKEGEAAQGMRPAAFYDHDNGRTVQMNVSGTNSAGVQPQVFAEISANLMAFEGFRQKKGKGSVGFGLHENSGMPVPDQVSVQDAVSMLKTSLEKQYIPNVKKQMQQYGISQDPDALKVLVDLNYHGGNGSSEPVAKAMQDYREAVLNPLQSDYPTGGGGAEAGAWLALRKQPAYKEAQPARKRYLEENLRDWMYSVRLSKQQF